MKVALITGSYPPDVCGVGDYTEKLKQNLAAQKVEVALIYGYKWKFRELFKIHRDIIKKSVNVVHIQYPTVGFGFSLVPQVLALICRNVIVTIHEVSQAHILRKLSLYPFFIFSRQLIFTSEFEKNYAQRMAPWIKKKSSIIFIGSNIGSNPQKLHERKREIVNFGIIRPGKGIEKVIELAKILDKDKFKVRIIGKVEEKFKDYLDSLKRISSNHITWNVNLDEQKVEKLLGEAKYAYLPFPDGASERRGSLLATLVNKVITFTTKGPYTTDKLERAVIIVGSAEDLIEKLEAIESNEKEYEGIIQSSSDYIKNLSWNNIAEQHLKLYQKISN